jgi:hypothetical protein
MQHPVGHLQFPHRPQKYSPEACAVKSRSGPLQPEGFCPQEPILSSPNTDATLSVSLLLVPPPLVDQAEQKQAADIERSVRADLKCLALS